MSGATWSSIIGGKNNRILQSYVGSSWRGHSVILGGSDNTVTSTAWSSAILGGDGLNATRSHTTFMNGLDVDTNSVAGQKPFKYHGTYANHGTAGYVLTAADALGNAHWQPGSGIPGTGDEVVISADTSGCTMTFFTNSGNTFTANTCTGGYSPYRPTGTNSIVPTLPGIGQLFENIISTNSNWSTIGGGGNNRITQTSDRSVIAGGQGNQIINGSDWSNISGGVDNTINDSRVSSILGGHQNTINIPGVTAGYGAIVAGYNNTVSTEYSTILNGSSVTTNLSYTAYIKGGLNIDTQSAIPRYFRYHGTLANEGAGRILTSDASGNATWQASGRVSYTGDQYVVSAYTTGCTLFLTTNSGNTYTADTCNQFSDSPYKYGGGQNSNHIPRVATLNFTQHGVQNSILNGQMNNILYYQGASNIPGRPVNWNTIINGIINTISGSSSYSQISNGFNNSIKSSSLSTIIGGRDSNINNSQASPGSNASRATILNTDFGRIVGTGTELYPAIRSSILNSYRGVISGATNAVILGGSGHTTNATAHQSVIVGGTGITARLEDTAYMSNSQTLGKARISTQEYLTTNSLNTTLPETSLDVVHDNANLRGMGNDSGGGEIVRFGGTGGDYGAGYLVQLQGGSWVKADAADVASQGNMLGIALGAAPTNGILIRGFYILYTGYDLTGAEVKGQPLYVTT